jgi:MYXO-CTERM domain-containing protein
MKRRITALKVLGLAMVVSLVAMVQANAVGFGGNNHSVKRSDVTKWMSDFGSWIDSIRSDAKNGKWHSIAKDWKRWDRKDWKRDNDYRPHPPKCVPEPSSALAGAVALLGLGAMIRRRR